MRGTFRNAPFKFVVTVKRRDGWEKEVDYQLPIEQITDAISKLVIPYYKIAVFHPLRTTLKDESNLYPIQELEADTVHSEIAKIEIKLTYKEI